MTSKTMTGSLLETLLVSLRVQEGNSIFLSRWSQCCSCDTSYGLDNHLNPAMQKPYNPAIQAVMKLVCKKLNQYYSMTDISLEYWITMGKQVMYFFLYLC